MKSQLEINQSESQLSLPKLETKNSLVYKKNALQQRISFIRESQDNIQLLEQMSEEFQKEPSMIVPQSFIQLPQFLQRNSSYVFIHQQFSKDDINKQFLSAQNTLNHTTPSVQIEQNTFKDKKINPILPVLNKINEVGKITSTENKFNNLLPGLFQYKEKVSQLDNSNKNKNIQSQQKFKKLINLKNNNYNLNNQEEEFIKYNWNASQKYEVQTGETLSLLFKKLAMNLQKLLNFKQEKFCIEFVEKIVNYNKWLSQLIDVQNTQYKDYNPTLLLTRYLKILYKILQTASIKKLPIINQNKFNNSIDNQQSVFLNNGYNTNNNQYNNNSNNIDNSKQMNISMNNDQKQLKIQKGLKNEIQQSYLDQNKEKLILIPIVHDKQFIYNILDFNTKLEDWIMFMQRKHITQFTTQLTDITNNVYGKLIAYKNQLIGHQNKQSYKELKDLIKNEYSLNMRIMKNFESKNGNLTFIQRQNISKGECLDGVITKLEKLNFY